MRLGMNIKKVIYTLLPMTMTFGTHNVSAATPMSIKHDITFATLNTTVNSHQPNNLIAATISDGKYKGAQLQGKLYTTNIEGTDKISLRFNSLQIKGEPKPLKIAAYAIDVHTAQTALNSKVTAEYFHKNGALFAESFIQAYSKNPYSVKINSGTDIGILFY